MASSMQIKLKESMPRSVCKLILSSIWQAGMPACSLMITHLNETGNCVLCECGDYSVEDFCELPAVCATFGQFYLSDSRYAFDIKLVK